MTNSHTTTSPQVQKNTTVIKMVQQSTTPSFSHSVNDLLRPIQLNVGGTPMTVSYGVLTNTRKEPNSILAKMITGEWTAPVLTNERNESVYFIECDPELFKYVLHYLRYGSIPPESEVRQRSMFDVANFFRLDRLKSELFDILTNQLMQQVIKSLKFVETDFRTFEFVAKRDLSDVSYVRCDFSGMDLKERKFNGCVLTETNFTKANLKDAEIGRSVLTKVDFSNCDLSNVHFVHSDFEDCIITGANLSGSNLLGTNIGKINKDSRGYDLSNITFSDVKYMTSELFKNASNVTKSVFCNCDLTDLDLSGCDFTGSDFSSAKLKNVNFSNSNLSGCTFSYTELEGCNFTGAIINSTTWENCDFTTINQASYGYSFYKSVFTFCTLSESFFRKATNLTNIDMQGSSMEDMDLSSINFQGSNFTNSNFSNSNLSNSNFTQAILKDAYLVNCNMYGCSLKDADFTNAKLKQANLYYVVDQGYNFSGCDLSESKLSPETLRGAIDLTSSNMSLCFLQGFDLSNMNLSRITIEYTNLRGINFSNSNLTESTLIGCDFSDCNLSKAILVGANLSESNFIGANMEGCTLEATAGVNN